MHKINSTNMMQKWLLIAAVLFTTTAVAQQKKLTDKEYAQKPHWIQMMETEGINFNETIKAFDIYWQSHPMPEEEGDRYIGKGDDLKKKPSKKEAKEMARAAEMRFQIKKFEHWKIINEPFVKENGNIMTADEKLKFHNQHN